MGEFLQNHYRWPPRAALDDTGVAVGSFGSVPAYTESVSAGQRPLPGSAKVAGDCFPHLAGNFHHYSCVCSPFCHIAGVHVVSGV